MPTIRQQIVAILIEYELGVREISQTVGIPEKEVYQHLTHIAQTLVAQNKKIRIKPYECLKCGFTFDDRQRFSKPGRCPKCKQTHVENPIFRIL